MAFLDTFYTFLGRLQKFEGKGRLIVNYEKDFLPEEHERVMGPVNENDDEDHQIQNSIASAHLHIEKEADGTYEISNMPQGWLIDMGAYGIHATFPEPTFTAKCSGDELDRTLVSLAEKINHKIIESANMTLRTDEVLKVKRYRMGIDISH